MDLEFEPTGMPGAEQGLKVPATAMDPHYAWAWASSFAQYGGRVPWYMAAFEIPMDGPRTESAVREHCLRILGSGARLHPPWWNAEFIYGTALVDAAGLQALEAAAAVDQVRRFEVALAPESDRPAGVKRMLLPSEPGASLPVCQERMLFGVVDHGCPLAHRRLRSAQGTRVLSFWDQDGAFAIAGASSPPGWAFGSAADAAAIDAHFGAVATADDWGVYRDAGLPELCRDASHGAHLLGCLFAANENSTLLWNQVRDHVPVPRASTLPDTADLVFVQLPAAYLQGVPRTSLAPHRLAGLRYIVSCAGPNTTDVIVPVASENYDGSHDGQSLTDQAVDALVDYARTKGIGLHLLVSAGNCLRTGINARVDLSGPASHVFRVRVLPGNERETFVELWVPASHDAIEFALQAPHATGAAVFLGGDGVWTAHDAGRPVAGIVSLRQPSSFDGHQRCILFALPATHASVPSAMTGPAGDWLVSVRAAAGATGDVCGYIARSTPAMGGRRRGYQSTFPHSYPNDWDFGRDPAEPLHRETDEFSLSGLATARQVQVVGGYQARSGLRAGYSAGGPGRRPARIKNFLVDVAAPTDESRAFPGIVGWGNRSGGFVRLSGTSVAAPLAARARARWNFLPVAPGGDREDPQIPVATILE